MTNKEYAESLRLVADFYEANPDLEQPYRSDEMQIWSYRGKEGLSQFARLMPGKVEKSVDISFYNLRAKFGFITLRASDNRQNVCEKVSIGVQTSIKRIPIGYRQEEVSEEMFEWRCPDSLLAPTEAANETL